MATRRPIRSAKPSTPWCPFSNGPYFAKLSVVPVAPELTALTDAPVEVNGKPDGLREAVNAHFARHGGVWEIRVAAGRRYRADTYRGRLGGLAGRPQVPM